MLFFIASLALAVSPSESCTMSGVVTVDGKPAAGVTLYLRRELDWQPLGTTSTTPDATGHYLFKGLLPGWYRVSAFQADAMPQAARSWYCAGFGAKRTADLAMKRGGRLVEGVVMDTNDAAIPGAVASVNNAGSPKTIESNALIPVDKQGHFTVRLANCGHWWCPSRPRRHRWSRRVRPRTSRECARRRRPTASTGPPRSSGSTGSTC